MDQSQVRGEKIPEEAWLRPPTQQWREEAREAVEREEVSAPQQRQQRGQDAAPTQTRGKLLPLHAVRRSEPVPGQFRPTKRVDGDLGPFVWQKRRSSGANPCSAPTSWTRSSRTSTRDPGRGVSDPPEVPPELGSSGLTLWVLAGLSSDSGLGGSTDGSTDILVFGSVVEGECLPQSCHISSAAPV